MSNSFVSSRIHLNVKKQIRCFNRNVKLTYDETRASVKRGPGG